MLRNKVNASLLPLQGIASMPKEDIEEEALRNATGNSASDDQEATTSSPPTSRRIICPHCERPKPRACICAALPNDPLTLERCHVLVLQHPHEVRRKNRSLFLAQLCLTTDSITCVRGRKLLTPTNNDEDGDELKKSLARLLAPQRNVWLVFPHARAKSLGQALSELHAHQSTTTTANSTVSATTPLTLIFIDATWKFASEMVKASVFPLQTQYVSLQPHDLAGIQPKRFDIRTPRSPEHLSTAECLALVVSRVEGNPNIYDTIMKPLDLMVAQWHSFSNQKNDKPGSS